MEKFLFKKISAWIVGLLIVFFVIFLIFSSGVLRDAYLGINKSPKLIRDIFLTLSEIPKNIYHTRKHFIGVDINAPQK